MDLCKLPIVDNLQYLVLDTHFIGNKCIGGHVIGLSWDFHFSDHC